MTDNRHDKFVSLAEKRVNRTLRDLRLVGNLANRKNYEYSDEQARMIIRALKQAVSDVERRFSNGDGERHEFKLR